MRLLRSTRNFFTVCSFLLIWRASLWRAVSVEKVERYHETATLETGPGTLARCIAWLGRCQCLDTLRSRGPKVDNSQEVHFLVRMHFQWACRASTRECHTDDTLSTRLVAMTPDICPSLALDLHRSEMNGSAIGSWGKVPPEGFTGAPEAMIV